LPDGSVETMAFGTAEQLEQFKAWLWQGPSRAKVEKVEVKAVEWEDHESFKVR
jgi:acylphosphatase